MKLQLLEEFIEDNNSQKGGNQSQRKGYDCVGINSPKVDVVHKSFLSNLNATHKQSVPSTMSEIKYKTSDKEFNPEKFGTIITAPYQAAERLTKSPDRTFIIAFRFLVEENKRIDINLSEKNLLFNKNKNESN